jgi:hypothetical protein
VAAAIERTAAINKREKKRTLIPTTFGAESALATVLLTKTVVVLNDDYRIIGGLDCRGDEVKFAGKRRFYPFTTRSYEEKTITGKTDFTDRGLHCRLTVRLGASKTI